MNPLDQLRDEIANLHLLADRLARKGGEQPTMLEVAKLYHDTYHAARERDESDRNAPLEALAAVRDLCLASRAPSHELVVAADAMRGLFPKAAHDCLLRECSIVDAYDAARSRHASGAQPDSACDEIGWLVEITGPKYWTGTPGCGNWTADSLAAMRFARRQDAEAACRHLAPSGAIPVEHAWVSHRPAGAQPSGAPAPASAQGEVCECGHGRAMHIDGDGLHDGECLYRMAGDPEYCPCEMFRPTPPSSEKTGEERK